MTATRALLSTGLVALFAPGVILPGRLLAAVDPGEARRLLRHELDGSEYDAAQPTWWDRLSKGFIDWLGSIRIGGGTGLDRTFLVIGVVVVVAVLVLVVLVYGLPRRRAVHDARGGSVFDDDDRRTAAMLRAAADDAARRGAWDDAVLDAFRALARGLSERDLVPDVPGATARTIAADAGQSFPAASDALMDAAHRFEEVRYAGVPATEDDHRAVRSVERDVASTRPATDPMAVPT